MLIKSLMKGLSTSILLSAALFANADEYTITFDETGLHGQTGSGNDTSNYGTLLDNEYGAGGIATLPGTLLFGLKLVGMQINLKMVQKM